MAKLLDKQRYKCALGAMQTVQAIERAIPILHSGPGCAQKLSDGNGSSGYFSPNIFPCTSINEKDVVFGGVKKLHSTIENSLKVIDADLYVVLTGCIPEIVGDDSGEVVSEFADADKPVIYAPTAGFKGNNYRGHEQIIDAIIDQYVKKTDKKEKGLVNIWADVPYQDLYWLGNLRELEKLLKEIGETTSGNTGIGLAAIAAAKGYPFRVYIQDQVSKERFQVIQAFGGKTIKLGDEPVIAKVLNETGGDFVAAIKALKEDVLDKEDHVVFLDQCSNPANPAVHKRTTGPEIWEDTDGEVDILVACVGTGGTISGTGAYLKEKNPNVKVVGVQPGPNSLPDKDKNQPEEEITGVHPFEGVAENLIPSTLDRKIYDEYIEVEALEAFEAAREVAANDGILIGTSSGAALYAAKKLAQRPENAGKKIVAIFPDTGLRYLSTNLFAPQE